MYKFLLVNLAFVGGIFAATEAQAYLLEEGEYGNLGYVPDPGCLSGRYSWLSVEAPREHPLSNANPLGGRQFSDIAFVEEFYVRTPTSGVDTEDQKRS